MKAGRANDAAWRMSGIRRGRAKGDVQGPMRERRKRGWVPSADHGSHLGPLATVTRGGRYPGCGRLGMIPATGRYFSLTGCWRFWATWPSAKALAFVRGQGVVMTMRNTLLEPDKAGWWGALYFSDGLTGRRYRLTTIWASPGIEAVPSQLFARSVHSGRAGIKPSSGRLRIDSCGNHACLKPSYAFATLHPCWGRQPAGRCAC